MKSRSNPFLEQTSTKQLGCSFLLNETTGAYYGTRTHDLHITSQTPRRPFCVQLNIIFKLSYNIQKCVSAVPIRTRMSTSNINLFIFKNDDDTYQKGRAFMQMYRVVPQTKRGNWSCIVSVLLLVDGGWKSWYAWSQCDVTCGTGTNIRVRTCTNPRPINGGLFCEGDSEEMKGCDAGACSGKWRYDEKQY